MHPLRISLVSYNIWNTERWAFRAPALQRFLEVFEPDVLCVQELRRKTRTFLDRVLPRHARVDDPFIGWAMASNIYWRKDLFSEIEHGAEDVGIKNEAKWRRLFWVRLKINSLGRSMLVATAHLTHQREAAESASGNSPRVGETKRIIAALRHLNRRREPLFLMGDFNDPVHPTDHLHSAGYPSSFAALGLVPPPTFKAYPTANVQFGKLVFNQCVDWLVANTEARAISTSVPQFFEGDAAPSDHWPVHAVYEIQ